jgi:polyisoprenoid-binding protein YceI
MATAADRETRAPSPEARPVLSGRWVVDPHASEARFVAGTFAGLVKTPGRFRSLSGNLLVDGTRAAGALVIDAASIDTANRMRDRHLRSRAFFDVQCFPHLRYEVHAISSQDAGTARIDGELVVAGTWTPLALDVTLHAPADGVVELSCHTEVDRVALGIKGAPGMVPRAVQLLVTVTLRRAVA